MKTRMKKLGCLFLAFSMSCQMTAMAAGPVNNRAEDLKLQAESRITKEAIEEGKESPYVITEEIVQPESKSLQAVSKQNVLPPQMGWSSWNCFRQNIDENKIREVGQALVDSELNEHGYVYLNMDDCWQSSMRDENGRMQFDLTNFPSGPNFIKELNNMAGEDSKHPLKVGLYSSCGDYTCEDLVASYKNEELDAQTFAEWGVEYFKYDYCHVVDMGVDSGYITDAPEVDYITVAQPENSATVKYEAEAADLEGNASKQGWYVTGLNKAGGAVIFRNVEAEEDGRYVLTIGFRKTRSDGKFAEVIVNDSEAYETTFAPTSGWSNTGRQQLYVDLKKGTNTIKIHNPIDGQKADSIRRYTKMGNALKAATKKVAEENKQPEKPIFYSVCEHGRTQPWTWASDFASSWRISGDINSEWNVIVERYDTAANLWEYQKPGAYNDPDMMEVGNGSLNKEENKSHFTLWCMLSAPLILGNDVRNFVKEDGSIDREASNGAYDIITNQELIDLNQSWPLLQCKRISQKNNIDTLIKPLADGEIAVCFFNRGSSAASTEYDLNNVKKDDARAELPGTGVYVTKDLWDEELNENIISNILDSGSIPAHGVKVYRVRAAKSGEIDKLTSFSFHTENIVNTEEVFFVSANVKNMGTTSMTNIDVELEVPEGFHMEKTSMNGSDLTLEEEEIFTWKVTAPNSASSKSLRATLTYKYQGEEETQTKTSTKEIKVMKEPADELLLGDMEWLSATDGWKSQPARNKSIGGNKITVDGVEYDSGVGTNSHSEIKVYLGGKNYRFTAVAGIDDEAIDDYNQTGASHQPPQLTFEMWADGVKIYDSGLLNMAKSKTDIDVLIAGCRELTLIVTEGGNTNAYDHGDWADAKFVNVGEITKYNITVEDTENGTITTNPADQVIEGSNIEITFTPDLGYEVERALVNGNEVTLADGVYVLENVRQDVAVGATFGIEKVNKIKNIALSAKASSPAKTAAGSGPERANDDDIDVTKNGFAILKDQDESVRYLQYDWEEEKDIESLEFLTSFGAVRGAKECDILISYNGETFEKLTTWADLKWEKNENVIESNMYHLTDEEKDKAKNIKAMRLVLTKPQYAWDAAVIMELRVMGKEAEQKKIMHTVQIIQPEVGGSISAQSNDEQIEDGEQIEEGESLTFTFLAQEDYILDKAYLNEIQLSALENNRYHIDSLKEDVSIRAEFKLNSTPSTEGEKEALKSAITSAKAYREVYYSEESYAALQNAIQEATVVSENTAATKEEINEQIKKLTQAIEELEDIRADKYVLTALYESVKSMDVNNYTEASVHALEAALVKAKNVLDKEIASKEEAAEAEAGLLTALAGLEKKEIDYGSIALKALCESVEKMDLTSYNETSVDKLTSALEQAKAVLKKENASEKEVAEAEVQLLTALAGLEKKEAETETDLSLAIAIYETYKDLNTDKYTEESAKTFKDALEKLKDVIEDTDAAREEADIAVAAVIAAVTGLEYEAAPPVVIVNTQVLRVLYQTYSDLDVAPYTLESAGKLKEALEAAEKVLKNQDISQDQVDNAAANLMTAALGLKMKEEIPTIPEKKVLKKGEILSSKGLKYKVTNAAKGKETVTVIGASKKSNKKIVILPAVTLKGTKCKVTGIGAKAFYKFKSLEKVTIGTNVTRIGKKAFYGASKLNVIVIKSKKLNKVKSQAFKGISGKAVIHVPASKKNYYRDLLKKKGQKSTVRIK